MWPVLVLVPGSHVHVFLQAEYRRVRPAQRSAKVEVLPGRAVGSAAGGVAQAVFCEHDDIVVTVDCHTLPASHCGERANTLWMAFEWGVELSARAEIRRTRHKQS